MFDLEDLATFVEVADAGGVTAGARRLGLPKSIVSRRLKRLEAALDTELLTRTTRGAALTEAGVTFRQHAARVVAELEAAREAVSPEGELTGRLRIAAPLTLGPTHFAPVLARLASRHPQLQVHTAYSDRFVDLVGEGFDAGIRVGYLTDSNLLARRIGPLRGRCVASPDYLASHGEPETPEALVEHQCLMQGTETWRFLKDGQIISVRPQGRFKADNGVALAAAAIQGLGIAALPDLLIQDAIASGALVTVLAAWPPPPAGIYLVRPPSDFQTRKVRVLGDALSECFESGALVWEADIPSGAHHGSG
ncbi:LysR family transcriptional regulator [Brevundimonas sp.]|uniref:LysR family transcriptional regulator n=1 Tax=Brevundimonas sp. TaxID=1871086 RepID=UPI002D43996A|nr:LysR family transcriptional regulator [Brevundimonas sp.]HYC96855.1 LysR family transcriptional regulator [Brevundimonas sp.]